MGLGAPLVVVQDEPCKGLRHTCGESPPGGGFPIVDETLKNRLFDENASRESSVVVVAHTHDG
jgi:hypothetical protein